LNPLLGICATKETIAPVQVHIETPINETAAQAAAPGVLGRNLKIVAAPNNFRFGTAKEDPDRLIFDC
jgi:hypothetical protein